MPFRNILNSRLGRLLLVVSFCGLAGVIFKLNDFTSERQENSNTAAFFYAQGLQAIDSSQFEKARDLLQRCLREDPKHVSARLYYGQLLREQGNTEDALRLWQSIQEGTAEEQATARFLEASVAIEKKRVDRSRDLLEQAVQLNPNYLAALEKLLSVYRMLRDVPNLVDVINRIEELRELSKTELILRTVPGEVAFSPSESLEFLSHSFQLNPEDSDVRRGLASVYLETGEPDRVLRLLNEIEPLATEEDDLLAYRVLALLELGNLENAREICVSGSHKSSQSVMWNYACSRVAFEREDWKSAISLMDQVYRTDPNHQLNCYYFGLAVRQLGQEQQARALLDRAVQLDNVNRLALRLTRETDTSTSQAVPLILELAGELSDLNRFSEAADWYSLAARFTTDNSEINSLYQKAMRSASSRNQSAGIQLELDHGSSVRGSASEKPFPQAVAGDHRNRQIPQIAFVDVHETAGLDHTYFNGQTGFQHLMESMGGGVIVIDYDNDGWDDLYFPQGCRLPHDAHAMDYTDRLFRNLRGLRFQDVTLLSGLGSNRYGLGGTAFDYDNDGDQDLLLTNYGQNQLYRNNGDGTFSDRSEDLDANFEEMSTSVAVADFNSDGFLDLYIANYLERLKVCRRADGTYAPCDPGNFQGQMDRLLISDGSGNFSDRSKEAGLDVLGSKGLGVVAGDLDQDGRIDVYVANDGVPNFLWKNLTDSGSATVHFQEIGLLSGTAMDERGRSQAGMGLAIADFNRDARLDLYVTNFFEEHNALYLNRGHGWFEDRTKPAGLFEPTLPLLGFGTVARDFNGDGTFDLLIANGHIFRDDSGEQPWKMRAQVFANLGHGVFQDQTEKAGDYFEQQTLGRGVAALDWNRDGRCDAVIVHQDRPAALLENRGDFNSPVLSIELIGNRSNRDAVGAEIRIVGDQRVTSYWMTSGGYLGTNSQNRLISAETASETVYLQVIWPGGATTDHQLGLFNSKRSDGLTPHWALTEHGETFFCAE